MRCASCGMENAPDSRFCGGCGAKQPSSGEQPRLAPTAKIPDEAPYPQQAARPATVPQGPVSYAPPSIPPPASVATPPPVSAPLSTPPPGSLVRPQSQQPSSQPPASQPPTSQQRPVSQPPASRPASQPPRPAPKPQVSSASGSFAVPPRRPIGLMVALVIIDLGLAAGGAVLMSKGLAAKSDKKAAEKKTEAPATNAETPGVDTAATAPAPAAASVAASAAASAPTTVAAPSFEVPPKPAPAAKDVGAAAREAPKRGASDPKLADKRSEAAKVADTKLADKQPASTKVVDTNVVAKPTDTKPADAKPDDAKPVSLVPTQPQDPYAAPNTEQEIDAQAAASKADFAACAKDHPAHGAIKIAFQVRYDGRVINAAAVENTTASPELARCLVTEISAWKVSAHNGTAINMLRPFTYP